MKFRIRHSLRYSYSEPVWLEPILVRLRPICNSFQQVQEFQLKVNPEPGGSSSLIDAAGNSARKFWFQGLHSELEVTSLTRASTHRDNPFDFLLEDKFESLPFSYPKPIQALLEPYLAHSAQPEIVKLCQRSMKEAEGRSIPFLTRLAEIIHDEMTLRTRHRGDPRAPEDTLSLGTGACRDLALLYAEACRVVGIAVQFVSGYNYSPDLAKPELHAWCEAYLPGAGWRGFDPSAGLATDSSYLAVAAGPNHQLARPFEGTFRGTARSRLQTKVEIETD